MKFLLYCQHLSGAGHFVRTYEIARALSERHEVHLVDGGRPVPRPPASISLMDLPRIRRAGQHLAPLETGRSLPDLMRKRAARLRAAAGSSCPMPAISEIAT